MSDESNIELTQVAVNKTESGGKSKKLKERKKFKVNDVWDLVIAEVGIACGIMLIILAVNAFGGVDLSKVWAAVANFSFLVVTPAFHL